jgi:VanZ family protein
VLRLWAPVVAVMVVIFSLSSLQDPPLPDDLSDKSGHGLGYAVLGVTVVRALAGGLPRPVTLRIGVTAVAITIGYGVTDELHQSFVPGRSAEVADLYADGLGALAATIACWAWGILRGRSGGSP